MNTYYVTTEVYTACVVFLCARGCLCSYLRVYLSSRALRVCVCFCLWLCGCLIVPVYTWKPKTSYFARSAVLKVFNKHRIFTYYLPCFTSRFVALRSSLSLIPFKELVIFLFHSYITVH